jgi:hypothetical protein
MSFNTVVLCTLVTAQLVVCVTLKQISDLQAHTIQTLEEIKSHECEKVEVQQIPRFDPESTPKRWSGDT